MNADKDLVGDKPILAEEGEEVSLQPALQVSAPPPHPDQLAMQTASTAPSPPQPTEMSITQGLLPLQAASGELANVSVPSAVLSTAGLLVALTAVGSLVQGEGLAGGIKDDKPPFMHAADKALREAKKVCTLLPTPGVKVSARQCVARGKIMCPLRAALQHASCPRTMIN